MKVIGRTNSFVITENHLDDEKISKELLKRLKSNGYNVYFKLYDDDNILYYSGYLHIDEDDEFAPLDWAMYDSGCTGIKYRNSKTGKFDYL